MINFYLNYFLGRCYLPKIEGPKRCNQLSPRYYYDYTTKQCSAFWWRGCLGNANNFASWEECQVLTFLLIKKNLKLALLQVVIIKIEIIKINYLKKF